MRADPELARRINLLFDVIHKRAEPPLTTAAAAAAITARGGVPVSAVGLEALRSGVSGDTSRAELSATAEFFGVPAIYLTETGSRTGIDAQLHLLRIMRDAGGLNEIRAMHVCKPPERR